MRKIKEVLRLRFELGLGQRQIARSCSVGHGTFYEYLRHAQAAGVTWPLPEGWDDRRLEEVLFGGTPRRIYETGKPQPDFAQLHEELQRHPHLTLQLAWEEYRRDHPDGYAYSRFCELYQHWRQQLGVVLRQEHKAGEKLFVDYAGPTIPVHDPRGGPEGEAAIFVAVLGASNYTYAEATASQELENWIGSHIRAFEFFQGVPKLVIPDNTRTGVLVVERWIAAALRHRKFFSLAELNEAIRELLTKLNQRPFRKRPGCRASLFQELDRPALGPLPRERYEFHQWATARVNIDYHVEYERHYYSVPYTLTGQKVEIRFLSQREVDSGAWT